MANPGILANQNFNKSIENGDGLDPIFSFNSKDYAWEVGSEIFSSIGFGLDLVSLGIDSILSGLVITGGIVGAGFTGLLDGPAVFGEITGFWAGVGLVEVGAQPLLSISNNIGSAGDVFSILGDIFSGETNLSLSLTEDDFSISGNIGSQTQTELISMITSLNAREVLLTTGIQAFDTFGSVPWGSIGFGTKINRP